MPRGPERSFFAASCELPHFARSWDWMDGNRSSIFCPVKGVGLVKFSVATWPGCPKNGFGQPGQVATLNFTSPTPFTGQKDRKSTRLNSSHQIISYAVFCL